MKLGFKPPLLRERKKINSVFKASLFQEVLITERIHPIIIYIFSYFCIIKFVDFDSAERPLKALSPQKN